MTYNGLSQKTTGSSLSDMWAKTGRSYQLVKKLLFELTSSFGVDARKDSSDRHPEKICTSCASHVRRATAPGTSTSYCQPQTDIVPVDDWPQCTGESCGLCVRWKEEARGGRTKKAKRPLLMVQPTSFCHFSAIVRSWS